MTFAPGLYAGFQNVASNVASKFWQFWPKLNIPCDLNKRTVNEIFVTGVESCIMITAIGFAYLVSFVTIGFIQR